MINLQLPQLRTVLCLGAHADDIEIGCGGTLLRLLAQSGPLCVHWIVLSAEGLRTEEARRSAALFLRGANADSQVVVESFRDSFFPYHGEQLKEYFRNLPSRVTPDLIFTHRREDMHQDHRLVGELTWNTFRSHLILEYEIPKYEGDLGQPNVYVPLEAAMCQTKIDNLLQAFPTQHAKPWFTADTFWALLRLRGLESGSACRYAEAFHARKLTL